jgi:Fur family transcriptional regulator, peroxide stress response regulator
MRGSHAQQLLTTAEHDHLRRALEQAGWRYTRQRQEVYDYLRAVACHPTAEDVYHAVRSHIPKISLATVYKALETLASAGLVTKLPDASGAARYDGRTDAHYHFRCARTGRVEDLPFPYSPDLLDRLDPALIETLRGQGFHVTGHRFELVGYFERG